jgi:hypothetical protein
MNNWMQNLYELVYLPWPFDDYGDGGRILVQPGPKEFQAETGNRTNFATSVLHDWANELGWNSGLWYREETRRTDLNFFRAIRNSYHIHGWPDRFEGSTFLASLKAFNKKKIEHDDKVRNANPMASDSVDPLPEEIEPRNEREEFLKEAAGQLAIKRTW